MQNSKQQTITVLGDGAFGTACAMLLARNGHNITLWCHNREVVESITTHHENKKYLPGIKLNQTITATNSLEVALANNVIFEAIPMMFLSDIISQASPFFRPDQCLVSLTKGIGLNTSLATNVIETIANNKNIVVMSGPSYAHELANNQPTGFVIASKDQTLANMIAKIISNHNTKTYLSTDTDGVQLIAALKNVCALGIGILEGAGYGSNTQALFIMQALEEIKAIFIAYKIPEKIMLKTIYGIAGIGDLMLTCFGKKSRNYAFGYAIGNGETYAAIITRMGIAPEGVNTLETVEMLSKNYSVNIPLFLTIRALVFEQGDVKERMKNLISDICT